MGSDRLMWPVIPLQAAMTADQTAAFTAFGPGWLTPAAAELFFASVFVVLMLWVVVLVIFESYASWQRGAISWVEAGRLILEVTFFMTLLMFLMR